ncbi:MAG: toprim domain-containing protein [Acidimicrobiales bacterium]
MDFYHRRLLTADDAGPARGYLRSRGYGGEIVRTHRIGWAPDGWDQLARHLRLSDDHLRDSGLGFVNKRGRQQDAFRSRVMFPISDERGDPVGFGGRILPGHEGPKYKNTTTESSVYDKSRVLYGLHDHREHIVKSGEAVVCEGYTDVIGLAEAGVPRAVATCGTALTEQHVKLLKRFSADRLVLAFDADAAGIAAAERVYAWERELGLDVRVADLPPGVDPADLSRDDPAELRRAITEAMPFLKFRLERALAAGSLDTVEARVRTAEAALAVVAEHPDALVRDQYLFEVADRCRVDVGRLRELLAAGPRPTPGGDGRGTTSPRVREVPTEPDDPDEVLVADTGTAALRPTAEDEALRLAIHRPDAVDGRLHPSLFGDPVRREAFVVLQEVGVLKAGERAGAEAAALLRRLAVDPGDAEVDDVLGGIARLAGQRVMHELHRASRGIDAEDRRRYSQAIAWLKQQTELLAERDTRGAAIEGLLPWLIEHGARTGE